MPRGRSFQASVVARRGADRQIEVCEFLVVRNAKCETQMVIGLPIILIDLSATKRDDR